MAELEPCSNPGCDQPGTNRCSACKTAVYCGVICQSADWYHHKEECQGHLQKVGLANFAKAERFHQEKNWVQTLRYGDLAATKLKQLKDRRLEIVQVINNALTCKFNALQRLDRHREAMECIKECYTLWAMNHLRNPGSINAALLLIQSCIHNHEFEDAERYARHAYFMIAEMTDNFIPAAQRPKFLANGSYWLAVAILALARAGGIPPDGKQKAGEEAIALARTSLEMRTRLFGAESVDVALSLEILSEALEFFNDVDDDEVIRLKEQSIVIFTRAEGISTYNVATSNDNKGNVHKNRAKRANDANDLDRCLTDLQLALSCYREAARIFRANRHVNCANASLYNASMTEESIRRVEMIRASQSSSSSSAAAAAATKG